MEHNALLLGVGISGFLLSPLIFQYLNRCYVPISILAIVFFSLNNLAPYSPEARTILNTVHHVPDTVIYVVSNGQNSLAKLNVIYFNSFH